MEYLFVSQSPQTGQFNSYTQYPMYSKWNRYVSIPSNGSIQFLLNLGLSGKVYKSQSPQTGQFNSYSKWALW